MSFSAPVQHRAVRKKRLGGVIPALVGLSAALLLAGCGSTSASSTASTNATSSTASQGTTVDVTLTNAGCTSSVSQVTAGQTTFAVSNPSSTTVSELELRQGTRIVAEHENITTGTSSSFSATLNAGSYTLYCPGGTGPESIPFVVTGS